MKFHQFRQFFHKKSTIHSNVSNIFLGKKVFLAITIIKNLSGILEGLIKTILWCAKFL